LGVSQHDNTVLTQRTVSSISPMKPIHYKSFRDFEYFR